MWAYIIDNMFTKRVVFLSAVVVSLSGCMFRSITETNIEAHGYIPNVDQIQSMRMEQPTKQQVQSVLGRPFIVGTYNDDYWYYIFYRTEQYAFSKKEVLDFKMVEILFDQETVKTVTEYNEQILQEVAYNTAQTDTGGKTLGIIEQVVGNIGKVRIRQKQR